MPVRDTQEAVRVLRKGDPDIRLTQIGLRVLRSVEEDDETTVRFARSFFIG